MTFFFISGFFIYKKSGNIFIDWKKLILNFIKTVFFPFIVVVLITLVFHNYFISQDTFISCIKKFDIKFIFGSIFQAFIVHYDVSYLPGTAGHLWYVFSYALIILAYPITRFILIRLPKYITYIILSAFFVLMVINDYHLFYGNPTYNIVFQIIPKPIFYSMWGHVLYNDYLNHIIDKKRGIIINKPIFILSIVSYVIILYALFKIQCAYYLTTNDAYVYTSWLSTFSLLLTTAFIIIIYDIDFDRFINDKLKMNICYISEKTLGIYLIHYLYVTKFLSTGFQALFGENLDFLYQHFIYHIFYTLLIFIISFITVILIEKICKLLFIKEVRHD